VLFQQKTTVRNHNGDLPGYLDWALDTARILRNQIRQSDIDRLVFTPRLWRLQELTGRNDRFTNNLLSAELVEKSDVFEQVYAALSAEISRWNPTGAKVGSGGHERVHRPPLQDPRDRVRGHHRHRI
jgi:hypothetical protein